MATSLFRCPRIAATLNGWIADLSRISFTLIEVRNIKAVLPINGTKLHERVMVESTRDNRCKAVVC